MLRSPIWIRLHANRCAPRTRLAPGIRRWWRNELGRQSKLLSFHARTEKTRKTIRNFGCQPLRRSMNRFASTRSPSVGQRSREIYCLVARVPTLTGEAPATNSRSRLPGRFTPYGEPVNLRFAYCHCYGDSAISLSPRLSGRLRTSHRLSNCIVARCSDVYFGQCGKSA
jgi:hypothetical protein